MNLFDFFKKAKSVTESADKRKKHMTFRILAVALAAVILASLLVIPAFADVGNQFGDGDNGGGGGWGGNDDWGDSDSDSGGLFFIFYIIYDIFGVPGIIILVLILIAGGYFASKKHKKGSTNPYTGVASTLPPEAEQRAVDAIRAEDPDFSQEQFKIYVNDVFLRVQEAWEAKNWKIVRPYESDKLFSVHERQLQEFIDGKKTNHMDGQCIISTQIAAFRHDGENDVVTVRLNATMLDYTTDDETGNLISGSKTERHNRVYKLEFIRTTGVKTSKGTDALASHECPSCGAPIEVTNSGQCEYCKNVITSGKYGWVLNEYSQWF